MVFILYKLYVLCPTPTLHLNLALTGDGAFLLSPKKTLSVWFISVLKWDTENVLINHLLLVIPVSYPCHYTNLCPHKPHKCHTHTPTHTTHTHTHTTHAQVCTGCTLPSITSALIQWAANQAVINSQKELMWWRKKFIEWLNYFMGDDAYATSLIPDQPSLNTWHHETILSQWESGKVRLTLKGHNSFTAIFYIVFN